ncbi:hypothetical protein H310_13433 [Aphanomyces invadans]|uniref:Uncharacterized protein n=1 Tax=Aphanomyces invadans TaxID=157072 RepID=A0A024TDR1_9STRA|nr:hypothetical protein H310_13433 [Aphanomyces invadans]ETV92193.1 hypothetical protein H310_13433 [Aphanomyces invadans]|eukprot:XP_008879157.1 hypothetical protein H310_13433 [Aphanomyces invadans]
MRKARGAMPCADDRIYVDATFPDWSPDIRHIGSGSADRYVYIWDADTGALRYHLPGHAGSVNEVAFHPNPAEPIVGSCGSDKNIYFGELLE